MDDFQRFRGGKHMRPGAISLDRRALGPVYAPGGVTRLRDEPGNGFSSLRDDNLLSCSNPAQQAGVAVPQVSNRRRFHDAPVLEHMGSLSNVGF